MKIIHIYIPLNVLHHSKVMNQFFWGCYNMGSYCYVIQMLLMLRVLPGGTESLCGIHGWHSKCYRSVDLSSVMPPRYQSSRLQRTRVGEQLMSCHAQFRICTCHLSCWWMPVKHQRKAVTCCIAFMYHICRQGRWDVYYGGNGPAIDTND